jgi:phosphoenolpyruvate-protein kinase (PTS system EI component)
MSDDLTKALMAADMAADIAVQQLRAALAQASAVGALVLMPMITSASQLHADIAALASAVRHDAQT